MNVSIAPIEKVPLENIFAEWPIWKGVITLVNFNEVLYEIFEKKGELLTLWGSDERDARDCFCLHLTFIFWHHGMVYLHCDLSKDHPSYPDISHLFPVANRMQRMILDLFGFNIIGDADQRSWIRHGAWPNTVFPLRKEINIKDQFMNESDAYHFIKVGGEGVHEIPVGPVHAGIIEPGHFRFNVVGERILRLEERLGYTHKGIAKHLQNASFSSGLKLVGRMSGDSTVAYAWAYSMALENMHQQTISSRAQWLRAFFLERERIANHLGDLGALGNDAGFSFGLNQFSRLKEMLLRMNKSLFGHRYLMDIILPGGVKVDLSDNAIIELQQETQFFCKEISSLMKIYAAHGGLQDRFVNTGVIDVNTANQLGMMGLVARASYRAIDWRTCMAYSPYDLLKVSINIEKTGDVAARVCIRFKELMGSLRLLDRILKELPAGELLTPLSKIAVSRVGIGCVEGWRGPVFVAAFNADAEHLHWAHVHDASWQNWPALEYAVIGDIVPDFPLINKSFNLSYSGHDG